MSEQVDRGPHRPRAGVRAAGTLAGRTLVFLSSAVLGLALAGSVAWSAQQEPAAEKSGASLEETRLAMSKWIETQQIISKERNDWQEGREVLHGRIELLQKELGTLEEKLAQARASADEAEAKKAELRVETDRLKSASTRLSTVVAGLESGIQRLYRMLPEPLQQKLQPLHARIPADPAATRASIAERFQNVLGILNEVNKSNNELAVTYEVRELEGGKPSEVRVLYVGLAQAYYVSAAGEGGIGRPASEGWTWEPSKEVTGDLLLALDVLQGKHTPVFVPLPVRMR